MGETITTSGPPTSEPQFGKVAVSATQAPTGWRAPGGWDVEVSIPICTIPRGQFKQLKIDLIRICPKKNTPASQRSFRRELVEIREMRLNLDGTWESSPKLCLNFPLRSAHVLVAAIQSAIDKALELGW